jgi:ribosomal protein S18 acetylase RimI-like enzyme
MTGARLIEPTPWDAPALGCDTFELADAGTQAMAQARAPGHYTVRVDPLSDKRILHENGFYYCDTLLEPYCGRERLAGATHPDATLAPEPPLEGVLRICHGAFSHGRFHRDFHVRRESADRRYDGWLAQLHAAGKVRGLLHRGMLAGFIAADGGKLVLHAVAEGHRGRGLAKFWWTRLCLELFDAGQAEVTSSISAGNLSALNLYASLGFRFRNPVDVYHRVIP